MIRTIVDPALEAQLPPRHVILTFDDGPNPYGETTARLLDVLRRHRVRAIFCPVGQFVTEHPELLRRVANEGHLIANHTQTHPILSLCSGERIRQEIAGAEEAIATATGKPPSGLFRPPFGLLDPRTETLVRHAGLTPCALTRFYFDTLFRPGHADRLMLRMLLDLLERQRGVVVLHERIYVDGFLRRESQGPHALTNRAWVPEAVDHLIARLKRHGFSFDPELLPRVL